jgi:hypothetical protein
MGRPVLDEAGRPVLDEAGRPVRNVKGSHTTTTNISKDEVIEYENWPEWAKELAVLRESGEVGVGDTLARQIGPIGKFVTWATHKIHFDCGCSKRKEKLNLKYPYSLIIHP